MKRIAQLACHHPKWSCAKIASVAAEKGSPSVYHATIRRNLASIGYMKWVPKNVPMLTKIQKQKRVEWCQKYLDFDWSNVVITDESDSRCLQIMSNCGGKNNERK